MDSVVEDHMPVVITRRNAESVVMVSLSDRNAMKETARLLSSPTNAARLADAIRQLEGGDGVERVLIEP
jgi:antitoxin YefM